jgi:hypothetical protein
MAINILIVSIKKIFTSDGIYITDKKMDHVI